MAGGASYALVSLFGVGTGHISAELRDVGPVATAPEPATWAMMILGFAALAAAAYRKQRLAVAI